MSNIVDLNELVPGIDGVTFKYNDAEYRIPGDLNSETVFEFLGLFDQMLEFRQQAVEAAAEASSEKILEVRDELQRLTSTIEAKLLTVFQMMQPDLKTLPFGQKSTMTVLGKVLESMGIGGAAVPEGPSPEVPTPATPRKKPERRKSTTSTRTKRATGRKTAKRRKS